MLFNSIPFLFLFLPAAYLGFWQLKKKNHRFAWLTLTGYIFYGMWNYKFCALMALSTLVSYLAGLGLLRWQEPRIRKLCLVAPITIDLLLLGFFKYFNFVLDTFTQLSVWLHAPVHVRALDIVLPVGISFYTFHTISYIVDSYRRVVVPTKNIFEFSCYVSLFSQLVAGPIVRFRQIEADLENLGRADRKRWLDRGWSFFAIGLMKKVLIADTIAAIINPALKEYGQLSTCGAWLCVLGYTYQLYFDFSGYSDMAVGLGYLFGIRLPQNFNSPYKAASISELWRRWHISLSTCLRDYLYIPLGGNRVRGWRPHRNVMITMVLGGLWRHLPQPFQFALGDLARFGGQLRFFEPLGELVQLVIALAFTQLLADDLELLAQHILALILVETILYLLLDLRAHLEHLELLHHELAEPLEPARHVVDREQLRFRGQCQVQIGRNEIGELPRFRDAGQHFVQLGAEVGRDVDHT